MRPEDMVGQLLGRYRIVRPVGYGGMATVFLAQDTQLRREVAMKVFSPKPGETVDFLRRFAREAQVLAQLDHPNILPIYDYGEQNGVAYLIMPYMAGGSLKELLQARRVLPPTEALRLIAYVLNALQYAHERGLIHRDIKPGNLLFKADGTLMLSDFGLVKVLAADTDGKSSILAATQTGQIIAGTPEYMAPEQALGQALPASDIYSVGVLIYEMLTGTRPFVADTNVGVLMKHVYELPPSLRQFNPQVSPQLDAAVLHALEKDPTKRYQRPADFLQALVQATQAQGPIRPISAPGWATPAVPSGGTPPPAQTGTSRPDVISPGGITINDPQANINTYVRNPQSVATPPGMGSNDPEANINTYIRNPQSPYSTVPSSTTPTTPGIVPNRDAFIPGIPSPGQYISGTPPQKQPWRSRPSLMVSAILVLIIVGLVAGLFVLPPGRKLLGLDNGQTSSNSGGNQGHSGGTPTTVVKPVKGGTWIDDLYLEPTSLIPNGDIGTGAYMVDQTIWAPLFYGDSQGNIQPGLTVNIPTVANGEVSADLKTWTFKLRPNLVWSDGQLLNADDVDFTWRLWNNPQFGAANTVGFSLIQTADVSADKLSITFHLSAKFEPFVSIWTDAGVAPLPKHVFQNIPSNQVLKSSESLKPSVSSGPWMMSESVRGDHYTVVRNPKYYQAAQGYPYLDSIVFKIVTNQDTVLSNFQAGNVNSSWFLDVTKTPAYKALTNYHIASNPISFNFEAIYFNLNNPTLKDVNIRKAIAMSIDQNTLIQNAHFGQGVPLCTDHSKAYHPGYEANAPCPQYNPTAARQILDQDGWMMGSDGYRHKSGKTLEFSYSTTANNPWRKADSLILQSEFKAIGIKLDITYYPASTFFGVILPNGKPGQYDIAEFENNWGYDADDSISFACNQIPSAANNFGGGNYSFYCNPQLDQLFVQEQSATDANQRQQIFNQIHQIYLTDFPFVTLYQPSDMAVVKNNAHNYLPGPSGASETVNAWTWWCDGGKC